MKRCLCPARLPCLDRGSPLVPPVSILRRRPLHVSLRTRLSSRGPSPERRQWSRHFSAGAGPPIDRQLLQDYVRAEKKEPPVSGSKQSNPEAWVSLLDQYLPPKLRRHPDDVSETASNPTFPQNAEYFAQTLELSNLLLHARELGKTDLLAHLGFRLNNWPAVEFLINRLLDGADSLKEVKSPRQPFTSFDWTLGSGISLDDLTDQPVDSAPRPQHASSVSQTQASDMTSLDAFTERPFANDHSKSLMAEVWQSLGAIVLDAADTSPNESKLAMSCVFRNLARLHHSGAVSDRVYKYVPPGSYQANFRPPGMHLLSTHIMNVLSDAAWTAHQAEIAAQTAAAGEDSPYLPFKMGIRELGPEIWLELILWCCVEHDHIKEGVWLVGQMRRRTGDQAWKFQSWKPIILDDAGSVWKTKIDQEETWRQHEYVERPRMLRKRLDPAPFHGLGERVISTEVASALLDNLPNQIYLGLGFRGMPPSALLRHISSFKHAIFPSKAGENLLPTHRSSNWFMVRVVESGGLQAEADPQMFDDFLRSTSCIVPPWDVDLHADEDNLARLSQSQLYDDTSALAGLAEYNIRLYSSQRLCGDALNAFAWLQAIVDTSKIQRIDEFFTSRIERLDVPIHTFGIGLLDSLIPFESSMPQLSNVTLAELLDLTTASRAFAFGDWLLFSSDADGPPVPPSAYGNQILAPSILRYAAATKNTALHDTVAESLSRPFSVNTLRALLNFRIATHQWDVVVLMLEYLRDRRAKSWGHSNITALAAEIIRLDHTIKQHSEPSTVPEQQTQSLARAKDILLRILAGEFNEPTQFSKSHYQERSLAGLHRIFLSIPGALHDLATSATPTLQHKAGPRSTAPYIPSTAFHSLLAAVVDTQGSFAGIRFWNKWCIDAKSPTSSHLQAGGITRLFLHHERNPAKGDPHFDGEYFRKLHDKAMIPNPGTVRIIAQAAVKEYGENEEQSPGRKHNPAEKVLTFCVKKFEGFHMRRREINREVGGFAYKKRRALDKIKKARKKGEKVEG
ncbi:hypothetical protein BO71DRAFT_345311 [Aspergillus ellipticus CBS 707.79]|uniref:Uncharacterized protein n=1 Tax=Aspergillus ellipticus CBS 707.79 TaxID=1448320 RepID=A0A319DLP7_9EURO|nr:hypothetical protein BO71DRAFT_345311 [Aspergillus ellipticus CBS 707.79]